jgi:imidazolonepropionase-like amidohydrolase
MSRWAGRCLALCLVVAASVGATAADDVVPGKSFGIRVGKLHVGDGRVIEDAIVVIEAGRFAEVTSGVMPAGVAVRGEYPEAVAAPGFVDAVTHLGLDGGAVESAEALSPDLRVAQAFDGRSAHIRGLLAAGTTSIGLLPAQGSIAAGRAATAETPDGDASAALLDDAGPPVFGFAPPALRIDRVPATLAGARGVLEAAFVGRPLRTPGEADPPVRRAALDALANLRSGPALAWADTPQAARVAVETLGGRGLTTTLVGLRGAATDPAAVASLGAPCIVTGLGPADPLRVLEIPARLHESGARVALSSGSSTRAPGALRLALALAVATGLPPEFAVPAVTQHPASALGVEGSVGRIARGLRADLLLFDGEPWELSSRLLLVVAAGRVVVDRTDDEPGSTK